MHFEGEVREGKRTKAWDQLCRHLRVSSETAQKALTWMHEQGIIGYSAFKNRVGIFIFLNRAASSIGIRHSNGSKKILNFPPASESERPASPSDTAFNVPFGDQDGSDTDLNPHAPKNGADKQTVGKELSDPAPVPTSNSQPDVPRRGRESTHSLTSPEAFPLDEVVAQLRSALEPKLVAAATSAAQREHERTREWLDRHGIPKATRVAQREAYNVLRSYGVVASKESRARADLDVGRNSSDSLSQEPPRTLTAQEIAETAETCLALLEAQGKSIELTLSEISVEGGGWLLPEDARRVREAARLLLDAKDERRSNDVSSC